MISRKNKVRELLVNAINKVADYVNNIGKPRDPLSHIDLPDRWVEWEEPYDNTGHVLVLRIPEEAAIITARATAASRGYIYDSDEQALEDFLVVHWGRVVNIPYSAGNKCLCNSCTESK